MLAEDIIEKISRDFKNHDEAELALTVLTDFVEENQDISNDRILRCMVFVANGDIATLEQAIELAKIDYRDLIVWAEYDDKEEPVRDLSNGFPKK
jgi:hypothetical protein